jgi:DNA repair exonuclease SbcCD ATPase subunit
MKRSEALIVNKQKLQIMKTMKFLLPALVLFVIGSPTFSQKYKNASDTAKLNKEYVEVSNDIAELTSKLTIAQNNLPGYQNKAGEATSAAQKTANESSEQASKATNGDLGDAKSAKKKAGKALNKAEDAKDANNKTEDQDKKIAKLSSQLQKKQERLQQLEDMRSAIRNTPQ